MTRLVKFYECDKYPTKTFDSFEIPDEGSEIWCTGWKHGKTIKPCGDGCHVIIDFSIYHCDEVISILDNLEKKGQTWGIEGVTPKRYQKISGKWVIREEK